MVEVQLAIYDLSRGMARSLSAQLLGPGHTIDIIPHTAILAFNKEYYFGGGIFCDEPTTFRQTRQMNPIEIKSLGRTTCTKEEFDAWCHRMGANSYSPTSYDLFNRNCNNFSHAAALEGLRLSQGVPQWILEVPQRFLSSPMGQMIRPMLEQMQVTGGPGTNENRAPSFGYTGATSNGSVSSSNATTMTNTTMVSAMENPWANIESSSSTKKETSGNTPSKRQNLAEPTPVPSKRPRATPTVHPNVLQSYKNPLISNDTNMVDICISKLSKNDNTKKELMTKLGTALKKKDKSNDSTILSQHKDALTILLDNISEEATTPSRPANDIVFSLMLLRLIVLHPMKDLDILSTIMHAIGSKLMKKSKDTQNKNNTTAVRAMAWCVLSNAIGSNNTLVCKLDNGEFLQDVIDIAMLDMALNANEGKVEVRQSAAAFLYNLVICYDDLFSLDDKCDDGIDSGDGNDDDNGLLSDIAVSLLCGVLEEGITDETDHTTILRRLLVAGKILCPSSKTAKEGFIVNSHAVSLANDVGLKDSLCSLQGKASADDKQICDLLEEILAILLSCTV